MGEICASGNCPLLHASEGRRGARQKWQGIAEILPDGAGDKRLVPGFRAYRNVQTPATQYCHASATGRQAFCEPKRPATPLYGSSRAISHESHQLLCILLSKPGVWTFLPGSATLVVPTHRYAAVPGLQRFASRFIRVSEEDSSSVRAETQVETRVVRLTARTSARRARGFVQTAQGTTLRPIVRAGPARYRMKMGTGIA